MGIKLRVDNPYGHGLQEVDDCTHYGLVGWYIERSGNGGLKILCSGDFIHYQAYSDRIFGRMGDPFGYSKITGTMDGDRLEFDQRYKGSDYDFHFVFRRKGNIWVGERRHPFKDDITESRVIINPNKSLSDGDEVMFHPRKTTRRRR